MKPTDRINEIYAEGYLKMKAFEKNIIDHDPVCELGLRFDAMMKYLDEEYTRNKIDNSGSL